MNGPMTRGNNVRRLDRFSGYVRIINSAIIIIIIITLAHTIHRKPTHTDRYLHSSSFHHPRFKSAVQNTLVR